MNKILVLDFGGQYNQLIARRVRDDKVYAEIVPYNKITPDEIASRAYSGIIFTGGPNSVYDKSSPHFDPAVLSLGIPVLGICYGHQLTAYMAGGVIASANETSEYGKIDLRVTDRSCPLFEGVPDQSVCWMSHTDQVVTVPDGFAVAASTDMCRCAAMFDAVRNIYSVQFHPEVTHTEFGKTILHNFLYGICGCSGDWTMENFAARKIEQYKKELAGKKVLCALSGGVDSSVAAVLLHKAIGDDLTCVFVDHGLLRKNEGDLVEEMFRENYSINLVRVDAAERFLSKLSGVTEPERKRKIIGEEFIRVFE
ncbi:MAG: glutamine-hydrolyzing GMP synthase, partial [Clostridia bacterium]|nr:glutamine-hydrolyzing GMP synthase [Clostridia bacterium]